MTFRHVFLALALSIGLPLAGGCSNETEGQPCDRNAANSGNSDCEPPLTCQSRPVGYRCCPPSGTSTDPSCQFSTGGNQNDASPNPPDSAGAAEGAADSSGADAARDGAAADATAPVDGGSEGDAPASEGPDAAGEGGAAESGATESGATDGARE